MTIIKATSIVPDTVFRIRSAERSSPVLYLEREANGDVRPVELNAASASQKWKTKYLGDGTYRIVESGSGAELSILPYQENNTTKYRLYSGGTQAWTLDARGGDDFVIGNPDNTLVVDIAANNWVVLWERRNALNQRWVFDTVDPLPVVTPPVTKPVDPTWGSGFILSAGKYDLVNIGTGNYGDLMGDAKRTWIHCTPSDMRSQWTNSSGKAWSVKPLGGIAYEISGRNESLHGNLFIPEEDRDLGVSASDRTLGRCDPSPRHCYLLPVAGTSGAFNIVADTAGRLKSIVDLAQGAYSAAHLADHDTTNKYQQWRFVPVS